MGWIDYDLSKLVRYVQKVSEFCKFPIPCNYPLSGVDAFRTATGVHASAIIKAKRLGDDWLADRVYSGVPAAEFGKEQQIEIGHMSGMSNVRFWLELRGIAIKEELCQDVLSAAKASSATLTEEEILAIVERHRVPSKRQVRAARGAARVARG
jgi:2-isopropylmalate synthase